RYDHLYEVGTIPEPETMWDDHSSRAEVVRQVRMQLDDLRESDVKEPVPEELRGEAEARERASWKYQRYMCDCVRGVQAVDDAVAAIIGRLEADGIDEHTIVISTSDLDFFLGDHDWFDTRQMLDESPTLPILIRWAAQNVNGARVSDMI